MNNQKGFIQIPILIVIIASVLVVGVGSYVIGVKQHQKTSTESITKTNTTQSGDLISPKIGKTAPAQETTVTTPSPKSASSIRYLSEETTLYALTVNQFGVTQLKYLRSLSRGTQVVFMNDVHIDWSKITVDNQEGWVSSRVLVNNEPSKIPLSTIYQLL